MAWIALGSAAIGAGASIYNASQKGDGGSDSSFKTQTLVDPLKQAVATPMSAYLAGQVGQGIGDPGMDPTYKNAYTQFMGSDANAMFDKNIYNPQLKQYQEQTAPALTEQFAGGLRGSGRALAQDMSLGNFEGAMGTARSNFYSNISKAQQEAGAAYNEQAYKQWSAGLPQNNPALKSGLDFLSNNTGTGTTVLSALDPGQQGWFSDLLNSFVSSGGVSSLVKGLSGSGGGSSSSLGDDSAGMDSSNSTYIGLLTQGF